MIRKHLKLVILLIPVLVISCGNNLPQFNGEQAYLYIEEQCALGPRYPGTEEIKLCREYIIEKLQKSGAKIKLQEFNVELDGIEYDGVNILAEFYPQMSRRILLGAHYDTRPWADKDSDSVNHTKPVLGANDGASGVAVLLEMAGILSNQMPAEYGVDLVFFDLEDMGQYSQEDTWCLGSEHFAKNYEGEKPEKAIVVDMIGDKDLEIPIEYYSYHNSPLLVREVWEEAKTLGAKSFVHRIDNAIQDDHYSLIKEGFVAIDVIDFDYEWWHTVEDTPDKCSAASLQEVGQVLVNLIYK